MDKAAGEGADRCRFRGDPGHNAEGEGKRRSGQSAGPGRGALGGRSQGRGLGKEVLTHLGEGDYECNPEEHTAVAAGRGTLRDRKAVY